jgi:hypothetical protein
MLDENIRRKLTTGPTGLYASLKVASGLLAYGQLPYEKKFKKWSD